MTVQNPESSAPRDGDTRNTPYTNTPSSSFLQMFLEARPPRDDVRSSD